MRMQLRVFVKTNFPGMHAPGPPPPQSNLACTALVLNAFGVQICNKCIGQILGLALALHINKSLRTVSGWLSGKHVRLSQGRSWVRVPAGSYHHKNGTN